MQNMGVTNKKYEVSVSFYHRHTFSVKPNANTVGFWAKFFKFFKSCKNLYTRPLCITNPEYVGHGLEIQSFDQFLSKTGIFGKTKG
jgi:hypothetical protein